MLKYAVTSGNVSAGSKSGTDIASKTGTSTVDSSIKSSLGITESIIGDSWQITYSPDYCYSVWVGYDKITSTQYLTRSVGNAAKKSITKLLTSGLNKTNSTWTKPSSVVTATVELETVPLQLASDYTPDSLKSVEYFKAGTLPDVSTRFSQLDNPTNLKANYSNGTVSLSWTGISTPDAINESYLTEYFNSGYKTFAEKYLAKRLSYNEKYIGTNGYHVYIKNSSGSYTDLGFTTSTSFNYTGTITQDTTFMVKSSYSIFKSNMSSGVTVTVSTSGGTSPSTSSTSSDWKIELNGSSTLTVQEYYDFINSGELPVKVLSGTNDVSKSSKINTTCWNSTNDEVSCQTLDCNQSYSIQHTVTYNSKSKSVSRILTAGC
jgi:membrane peptidoglycan carboxypeptidase